MSSTTTYQVRPATLRDAKQIAELHNATVRDAFKTTLATDTPLPVVPLDKRQAYWREAIEYSEPQVHVALDDDKIVGFVGFDRSRDKGTPQTMGEIWAIYVATSHWAKGVGLSLWDAARDTAYDVAARLAIVPMVLEARALDVTPATLERVQAQGDARGAKILQRILDDEIRHVAAGAKHFIAWCEKHDETPDSCWRMLVARHFSGAIKPPFNDSARHTAGLSREFMAGVA